MPGGTSSSASSGIRIRWQRARMCATLSPSLRTRATRSIVAPRVEIPYSWRVRGSQRSVRRCAFVFLTSLGISACARTAGSTTSDVAMAAGTTGVPLFADEFSGPALDRTKWTVYTGPVYNSELQEYVDDSATVSLARGAAAEGAVDGALVIRARRRGPQAGGPLRPEFVSGRLHGRVLFRFGTVAARMKLPAGAGLWPAFWLLGGGEWPASGEIDVMENVGDSTWVSVALHGPGYSGDTPLVRRTTLPAARDATQWHEYAVTWTADSIVFRVDGETAYRVTRDQVAAHGPPAALDSAKYVVLNLALGGTYPAAVNGVRAPRLGLPDATVERIRDDEAKLLVDWVRARR